MDWSHPPKFEPVRSAIVRVGEPWERQINADMIAKGVPLAIRQDVVRALRQVFGYRKDIVRATGDDLEGYLKRKSELDPALMLGLGASFASHIASAGGVASTWQTLFSVTLTTNATGFGGWTTVSRILPAATTGISGGTKLRVRCVASTAADLNVLDWRIGHAAAAGDAYDFDGTQQPILRGGGSPDTIANSNFVSDDITYSYDTSKALLLALSLDTTSSIRRSGAITNTSSYQKNSSNDANTTDKSGYSAATGMHSFDLIEVYAP